MQLTQRGNVITWGDGEKRFTFTNSRIAAERFTFDDVIKARDELLGAHPEDEEQINRQAERILAILPSK